MEGYNHDKVIEKQLRQLGLKEGDILLVHSSLESLETPGLKVEMVIKGIESVLGEKGTLLMPTITYQSVDGYENDTFSVKDTKSECGILSEYFRKMPGVIRSVHPTHSVCAKGRFAKELVEDHYKDDTPCGPNSPYRLLKEMGGKILFLGCGLEYNLSIHAIEELVEPNYLFGESIEYKIYNVNREKHYKTYKIHSFKDITKRYDKLEEILEEGIDYYKGDVLGGGCCLINAQTAWKKALKVLKNNPNFFVE